MVALASIRRPSSDRTWRETLFEGTRRRLLEGVKKPKVLRFFSIRMIARFGGFVSRGRRDPCVASLEGARIFEQHNGIPVGVSTTNKECQGCLESSEHNQKTCSACYHSDYK